MCAPQWKTERLNDCASAGVRKQQLNCNTTAVAFKVCLLHHESSLKNQARSSVYSLQKRVHSYQLDCLPSETTATLQYSTVLYCTFNCKAHCTVLFRLLVRFLHPSASVLPAIPRWTNPLRAAACTDSMSVHSSILTVDKIRELLKTWTPPPRLGSQPRVSPISGSPEQPNSASGRISESRLSSPVLHVGTHDVAIAVANIGNSNDAIDFTHSPSSHPCTEEDDDVSLRSHSLSSLRGVAHSLLAAGSDSERRASEIPPRMAGTRLQAGSQKALSNKSRVGRPTRAWGRPDGMEYAETGSGSGGRSAVPSLESTRRHSLPAGSPSSQSRRLEPLQGRPHRQAHEQTQLHQCEGQQEHLPVDQDERAAWQWQFLQLPLTDGCSLSSRAEVLRADLSSKAQVLRAYGGCGGSSPTVPAAKRRRVAKRGGTPAPLTAGDDLSGSDHWGLQVQLVQAQLVSSMRAMGMRREVERHAGSVLMRPAMSAVQATPALDLELRL